VAGSATGAGTPSPPVRGSAANPARDGRHWRSHRSLVARPCQIIVARRITQGCPTSMPGPGPAAGLARRPEDAKHASFSPLDRGALPSSWGPRYLRNGGVPRCCSVPGNALSPAHRGRPVAAPLARPRRRLRRWHGRSVSCGSRWPPLHEYTGSGMCLPKHSDRAGHDPSPRCAQVCAAEHRPAQHGSAPFRGLKRCWRPAGVAYKLSAPRLAERWTVLPLNCPPGPTLSNAGRCVEPDDGQRVSVGIRDEDRAALGGLRASSSFSYHRQSRVRDAGDDQVHARHQLASSCERPRSVATSEE
jgi:hypothetical protein